jgi:hypothetical protein
MADIELKLTPPPDAPASGTPGGGEDHGRQSDHRQPEPDHPLMGYFAVGFGLLGIFTYGPVFTPLSLICSVLALLMGQFVWGFVGILLVIMGILTSFTLLMFLGMGAIAVWLDLPWF